MPSRAMLAWAVARSQARNATLNGAIPSPIAAVCKGVQGQATVSGDGRVDTSSCPTLSCLLANDDITVKVNGEVLDPAELIEGVPVDICLDDVDPSALEGRDVPVLTIVDWTDEMRSAPAVMLCNEDGMALVELDKPAPNMAAKTTGYLKWSGFNGTHVKQTHVHMQFPDVIDAATKAYNAHVNERLGEITTTIVTRLKSEGIYPYETGVISDPIQCRVARVYQGCRLARHPLLASWRAGQG